MRQSELGGFFAPNYRELVDMSKTNVSMTFLVDCIENKSQKYQRKSEVSGVITPKNGTTIDLNAISAYDLVSVDITDN